MVAYCLGDALPGRVVLLCRAHAQQRTEIFHAVLELAGFIYIEAMHDQRLSVTRDLGARGGQHPCRHLHGEVLVERNEWQVGRRALDDVLAGEQGDLLARVLIGDLALVEKLGYDAGNTTGCMLSYQLLECLH
ncbi:hypothetical protein D3C71_1711140 [compost metagenome]